jgi:hypothetical protein
VPLQVTNALRAEASKSAAHFLQVEFELGESQRKNSAFAGFLVGWALRFRTSKTVAPRESVVGMNNRVTEVTLPLKAFHPS